MAELKIGEEFQTGDSRILVSNSPPLAAGEHEVQLVVVDDSGNASDPVRAVFNIVEPKPPTPFAMNLSAGVPPLLRAQGFTEKAADIVLTGTGGTPAKAGADVPLVNITVFVNTDVTSPILIEDCIDLILLIDPPVDGLPSVNATSFRGLTAPLKGNGSGLDYTGGSVPNFFLAHMSTQKNQATFTGIPLEQPGTDKTRLLRIVNLRVNAAALGAGSSTAPGGVNAFVSIAPQQPLANSTVQVGFVQPSVQVSFRTITDEAADVILLSRGGPDQLRLNQDPNRTLTVGVFNLAFQEGFADPFKNRVQERSAANSDTLKTGTPPPPDNLGEATNGTRFRAIIDGVPAGALLLVTTRDVFPGTTQRDPTNPTVQAVLIDSDSDRPDPKVPPGDGGNFGPAPLRTVAVAGGSAAIQWEWVSRDRDSPLTVGKVSFTVVFVVFPTPGSVPALKITAGLAPAASKDTAAPMPFSTPVPRFDGSGTTMNVLFRLG